MSRAPFVRLRRLGILLPLFFNGCAARKQPAAALPGTAGLPVVGEIAIVNKEKRFVLIDLDSNLYVPSPGTLLRATSSTGQTAHLKASLEQKRPFIAADIVDGQPAVGDEVAR